MQLCTLRSHVGSLKATTSHLHVKKKPQRNVIDRCGLTSAVTCSNATVWSSIFIFFFYFSGQSGTKPKGTVNKEMQTNQREGFRENVGGGGGGGCLRLVGCRGAVVVVVGGTGDKIRQHGGHGVLVGLERREKKTALAVESQCWRREGERERAGNRWRGWRLAAARRSRCVRMGGWRILK